jgi:NAD-dependent SIR2 family protein deacetylase
MVSEEINSSNKKERIEENMFSAQQMWNNILRSPKRRAEVRESIIAHQRNYSWMTSNIDKLHSKYENKFVAIDNQKVVAASTDIATLREELKNYSRSEIVAITFIIGQRQRALRTSQEK